QVRVSVRAAVQQPCCNPLCFLHLPAGGGTDPAVPAVSEFSSVIPFLPSICSSYRKKNPSILLSPAAASRDAFCWRHLFLSSMPVLQFPIASDGGSPGPVPAASNRFPYGSWHRLHRSDRLLYPAGTVL